MSREFKSALIVKSPVLIHAVSQLSTLLLISLVLFAADAVTAKSFFLGGLVYIVPNLYFVYYAFRYSGAPLALYIMQSFSKGESGKIALATMGFALVFRFVEPLSPVALFAGFVLMIVLQWFIAAYILRARDKSHLAK